MQCQFGNELPRMQPEMGVHLRVVKLPSGTTIKPRNAAPISMDQTTILIRSGPSLTLHPKKRGWKRHVMLQP